jgi:hypothetical protein
MKNEGSNGDRDQPGARAATDEHGNRVEPSVSPREPAPAPWHGARFAGGAIVAVAIGVFAERLFAQQRDSMSSGLYCAFLLLAFAIGVTQRNLAWLIGLLLLPSYWWSALSRWPSTSTAGVGCCISVLFAVPHAVAAQLGMWCGRAWGTGERQPSDGRPGGPGRID